MSDFKKTIGEKRPLSESLSLGDKKELTSPNNLDSNLGEIRIKGESYEKNILKERVNNGSLNNSSKIRNNINNLGK